MRKQGYVMNTSHTPDILCINMLSIYGTKMKLAFKCLTESNVVFDWHIFTNLLAIHLTFRNQGRLISTKNTCRTSR